VEIPIQLTVLATSSTVTNIPQLTFLSSNYPNPFNPQTTIPFAIAQASNVTINIYNSKGQLIRSLLNETKQPGFHEIIWDGLDNNQAETASGIYLVQMKTKEFNQMKKMILMK